MNAAHAHLLVNHVPIMASLLAVPILALALGLRTYRGLTLAGAALLVMGLAGAGLASWSGDGAAEIVQRIPGVQKDDIETHEHRADVAIGFAALAALAGVIAVGLEVRRATPLSRQVILAVLILAVANAAAMGFAGLAGGRIRHTEIRSEPRADATPDSPEARRLASGVTEAVR